MRRGPGRGPQSKKEGIWYLWVGGDVKDKKVDHFH